MKKFFIVQVMKYTTYGKPYVNRCIRMFPMEIEKKVYPFSIVALHIARE